MTTEAPRNLIVADVAAWFDAALKGDLNPGAWCTADASTDPDKVEPEKTPLVVLWEGSENEPDTLPVQLSLDRCLLQITALMWVKNKKCALEVQQELNRVIWCLKRAAFALTEAGGRQVSLLRKGAAIETSAGDSFGDGMYRFTIYYDVAMP